MTRLEHLSQFSNAVLSPELNTCEFPMPMPELRWVDEIEFRKKWCEDQISLIGEFGAVFEMVLAKQLFGVNA